MTDVETQASQRTVVAFISGLLIGGLLVWFFASTPEDVKTIEDDASTDVEQVENTPADEDVTDEAPRSMGDAAIEVADQDAGTSVAIDGTTYPDGTGWVVVRDHEDGVSGGILGAARYDTELGLTPISVELLRATVSGSTYEALFYSDAGTTAFDLSEDAPVSGTSVTFTAN